MRVQFFSILFLVYVVYGKKIRNADDKTRYNSCDDVFRSGNYNVSGSYNVFLNSTEPFQVHCDFAAGRTVVPIMQQKYGHISFKRYFRDYVIGFGNQALGDFWLGLARIKTLTDNGYRVLTVTMQDCAYQIKVLRYNYFFLGPAHQRYPLHIGGYVSSHVLPDDFGYNNGMPFSTMDRPDVHSCAIYQKGGWWYNHCTLTLPTGHYYAGCYYKPSGKFYDGIYYKDWHGFGYSMKYFKMELSNF